MRILQAHARYRNRGGEDTTVANEGDLLRNAGHSVHLLDAENAASPVAALGQLARSTWNRPEARRMSSAIAELRPDVVHVHNTWFALSPAVLAAARRQGVPVVMTVQNYRLVCVGSNLFRNGRLCEDCVGRGPWRGVAHRCYRGSGLASGALATNIAFHRAARTWHREVDVVVAVSEFGVERLVAGGVPREKIVIKDNFTHEPPARRLPPSESDQVLFVGRPTPEKGLELVLEAWRGARPSALRLEVVGAPDPAGHADRGDGISFLGPLPHAEVQERMRGARALLVPSQWPEGQPLVVLEALAAGLPVVGTAIGGIEEVLRDDPRSRLVALGDLAGWQTALGELSDGTSVDRRGSSSRALYERRFTPEVGLRRLIDVYRLAGERHASRESGGPSRLDV